jgi:UDP-glucose 4-epimerase
MAPRRVLLTGGGGFFGSNILESPLKERYEFVSPSRRELDLADTDQVDAFFKANRVDAVIHAAVKPALRNDPASNTNFYANTRQYFNLARHAAEVERVIVLSSGAVYGRYAPRMGEEYFGVHVPADEYGFSKYVCETHAAASENIVSLRLFGVFGKREDHRVRFISNLLCRCILGLPLTINQDRRFDFLDVDDLMPVLDFFLSNRPRWRAYNVCPDEAVSLSDLAASILQVSGKDLPVRVKTPGLGTEYSGDNARLKGECPAFKTTPMTASLARLHRWYLERAPDLVPQDLLHDA